MATLICNATGNLTGAATFAAAEAGALALNLVRNNTASLATAASVTSATFTVTNAKVIDAVLLFLETSGTVGTGTFKVDLQKGGVSQASVTVNKSDLPNSTNAQFPAVLFKLTSTATGDGGANWTIVLTTTSGTGSATVSYVITAAGASNFTRALRTTTAATPAAADDLYVVGELTGAGTHTSRTVTMDQTATTAYGNGAVASGTVNGGGIRISNYGTLSYGTAASTNYVLRVNGDVEVFCNGTLNIGASGAEIPRSSTAVLEFQMTSASGDFGLIGRDNSTINIAGLSRTSGKNIVKCKLTSDVTASSTVVGASANQAGSVNTTGVTGALNLTNGILDNSTTGNHFWFWNGTGSQAGNTSYVAVATISRGTGANNRFMRLAVGSSGAMAFANGFFTDIDLQLGTASGPTAVGNGTATSVSITAVAGGWEVRLIGKVSSGAVSPVMMMCTANSLGGISYTGTTSSCFNIEHYNLLIGTSLADTTFNVDTDTGWLNGDQICVASTSRTNTECEDFLLNASAGASSMTSAMYPFANGSTSTHSGTSPTQAEVGLVTRNVKIRSTSSSLLGYVYFQALATVNFSWAEFYYFGANITSKFGFTVDSGATASAKSVTFCSMHDLFWGFVCNTAAASINLTYTNNVVWNIVGAGAGGFTISALSSQDLTFTDNLVMLTVGVGFSSQPGTYTFNNNTFVGSVSWGVTLGNVGSGTNIAAWSGNTIHSNGGGMQISSAVALNMTSPITLSNWSVWRNNSVGMNWTTSTFEPLILDNWTMFGNVTANINLNSGYFGITIRGGRMSGDTTFATTNNFNLATGVTLNLLIDNLDTSVTGIYAGVTNEFNTVALDYVTVVARNCKWGGTNLLDASFRTKVAHNMVIANERYGQTAGDHRCELYYGQLKTDTGISNNASPSQRMTPNNASNKLESAPPGQGIVVAVPNGSSVNISAYVRKSVVGDGAAYNGNQPRLIQRANGALGQNSDVVLATYTSAAGSWNQLNATSSVANDNGAWEFVVDCDGTAGWVNVDDWATA